MSMPLTNSVTSYRSTVVLLLKHYIHIKNPERHTLNIPALHIWPNRLISRRTYTLASPPPSAFTSHQESVVLLPKWSISPKMSKDRTLNSSSTASHMDKAPGNHVRVPYHHPPIQPLNIERSSCGVSN
jgi:hypothetical protein